MKKRFLSVITSLVLMLTVALATATQSYAYVLGGGSGGDDKAFVSEYAINKAYQGWLFYWIDRSQTIVSDIKLVCEPSVANTFASARYIESLYTRYGHSDKFQVSFTSDFGNPPTPYSLSSGTFNANGSEMKTWIGNHHDSLVTYLNAPEELIGKQLELDKYFFIAEPVYGWWLYSNKPNVPREMIVGTPYSYSNYLLDNILDKNENYMNATQGLFKPKDDIPNRSLTYYGWWGTCKYTNGYYGTCVALDTLTEGVKNYLGYTQTLGNYNGIDFSNHPLPFSEFASITCPLGIEIMSNSDSIVDPNPDPDPIVTTPYVGTANPDVFTYHYSNQFELSKYNDPTGRIPSGEFLTNGIDVDIWYCDYELEKKETSKTVKVNYTIFWTEIDNEFTYSSGISEADLHSLENNSTIHDLSTTRTNQIPHVDPVTHLTTYETTYDVKYRGEHTESGNYTADVTRDTHYYDITDYNIYTFYKAEIEAESAIGVSLYEGNKIIYNGDYDVPYTIDKTTGGILYTPKNNSASIWADSFADGKEKIERTAKYNDAENYVVRNDYFNVNGVTFVSNAQGTVGADYVKLTAYDFPNTGVGNNETLVRIPFSDPNDYYYTSGEYTYRSVLDKTKGVTIKKYASEIHSAYRASINERIHSSFTQNEPVFVHTPVVTNIDTYGDGDIQLVPTRVNEALVDFQLRLDNMYSFEFDIEKHLDLLGYSKNGLAWDYATYVKKAQVLFPFDVAIVTQPMGENVYDYYKANTWIDVDYLSPTYYYVPSWAKETDYGEIIFRTIAYNIDDSLTEAQINALEQETHNLESTNYVAYTKIAVQLSGYVYDLQVVGLNDSVQIEGVDFSSDVVNHDVQLAKNNNEFRIGLKNRLGGDMLRIDSNSLLSTNWDVDKVLPFANGSSFYSDEAGTLYKATRLNFIVKTISNLWNDNDELIVTPRLRYVDESGTEFDYDEIQVYYGTADEPLIKMNSDKDKTFTNFASEGLKIEDGKFVGTYTDHELESSRQLYNAINGTNYNFSWNITSNNGKGTFVNNLGSIVIPQNLRLFTGNEEDLSYNLNSDPTYVKKLADNGLNVGRTSYPTILSNTGRQVAQNTQQLFESSMQTWYGEWYLPSLTFVVKTQDVLDYLDAHSTYLNSHHCYDRDINADGSVDMFDVMEVMYACETGLDYNNEMWVKDGYLVLNFDITVKKDGMDYLTYYGNANTYNSYSSVYSGQNMMLTEASKGALGQIVEVGGRHKVPVQLRTGDIAIFYMRHSTKGYTTVGVGWSE